MCLLCIDHLTNINSFSFYKYSWKGIFFFFNLHFTDVESEAWGFDLLKSNN